MLAPFTQPSTSVLWRDRPEPRVSRLVMRLRALAYGILKALLFVSAATLAISIVIFLRIVLTAHQLPRWEEELARFLPFLD
jgi:hypothetical protein